MTPRFAKSIYTMIVWSATLGISSTPLIAKTYGATFTSSSPQPLAKVIEEYKGEQAKNVVVTGQVEKVCEKKGCWMSLKDGAHQVRVTFKNYGFFVPTTLMGKKAVARGTLVRKTLTKDEVAHYLEDEGLSKKEAIAKAEVKETYEFVADGVKVEEKG